MDTAPLAPPAHRLYTDLAQAWPLLVPPEAAEEDAHLALELLGQALGAAPASLLELGCGGGGLASHLPDHMDIVLTDLSEEMLALSRALNPRLEHRQGDMRSLRLDRTFDAVLLGDAVMYMTGEDDLAAALATAAAHLRPGGALLVRPDAVAEDFDEGTLTGGFEGSEGTAAQLLEWHHSPEGTTYLVDFALLLREPGGAVRCMHEQHRLGLFPRAAWWRILRGTGLEPVAADLPLHLDCGEVFLARRPALGSAGSSR